jgi:hypothetical protein
MPYPTPYSSWLLVHPLLNSLIYNNNSMNISPPPPTESLIITETGDYIITEVTSDFMITE